MKVWVYTYHMQLQIKHLLKPPLSLKHYVVLNFFKGIVKLLIPIYSGTQTSAELRSKMWELFRSIKVLIICLIQKQCLYPWDQCTTFKNLLCSQVIFFKWQMRHFLIPWWYSLHNKIPAPRFSCCQCHRGRTGMELRVFVTHVAAVLME